MSQTRGPYDRPMGETLQLALDNVRANPVQYTVNHVVLAPVLIWAGRTPVRDADLARVPSLVRWPLWGIQLAFVVLALWQAVRALGDRRLIAMSLAFLGTFAFLTVAHVLIAVDERFTRPALPLVQLFGGAGLAALLLMLTRGAAQPVAGGRPLERSHA
jgi:hypothetical protein